MVSESRAADIPQTYHIDVASHQRLRQVAAFQQEGQQQQQDEVPDIQASSGDFPAPKLTHLVLVAGHAVYTGLDFAVANQESSWFLEPYQQVCASTCLFPVMR